MNRYARGRSTVSKRFFIVFGGLLVLIVILSTILVLMSGSAIAGTGTLSFSEELSGIVIRDETCYQSQNHSKSNFLVDEGETVLAGTPVADVYTWDYSDTAEENLIMHQNSILDYQQNNLLKDVENKGLVSLNESIAQKSDEIAMVISGSASGNLLELEKQLKDLLDQRSQFLRENVQTDATLDDYYTQEQNMKARIDDWEETVAANSAGIVSYYFDGLEQLMTVNNMRELTVANLQEAMSGKFTTTSFTSDDATKPLYRLVNQNHWYITVVTDHEIPEFENTNAFKVVFNDNAENVYSATVSPYNEESVYKKDGADYIYYLEFTGDVSDLLLVRSVNFTASADYVGISIPKNAIKSDSAGDYIQAIINEKTEKIYIKVLIIQEDYAIVEAIDVTSGLADGIEVVY